MDVRNALKIAITKAIQSFAERKGYAKGIVVTSPSRDIRIESNYTVGECEQSIYLCSDKVVRITLTEVIEGLYTVTYNSALPTNIVTSDDIFDFVNDALNSVGYSWDEIYMTRKFNEEDKKRAIVMYNENNWGSVYDDTTQHCLELLTRKLIGHEIPLEYQDDIRDPFTIFYENKVEDEMRLLLGDENRRNELEKFIQKMDSK